MRGYKVDLHVHTCLSPCGDLDASPRGVVEAAVRRGLDIIAVCDHNSAENTAAAIRAAARTGSGLVVLPGLEVCTAEEVHVLCIFETVAAALEMQEVVYDALPREPNRPAIFGEQVAANEDDEVEWFNPRLLIGAVSLDLADVIRKGRDIGGIALAAHVDRVAFGLLHQLGFLPTGFEADALEVSARCDIDELIRTYPALASWPIVRSSDAHFPEDVGSGCTELMLESPTLAEVRMALHGRDGRRIADRS